jgi:hypothetical protein
MALGDTLEMKLGLLMCLKKDDDAGRSFSTHFHVIGQITICWGLNFLVVLNLLFIVIYDFLTLKCGGDLNMLMIRIFEIILINYVVPFSQELTLKLFFLYSI